MVHRCAPSLQVLAMTFPFPYILFWNALAGTSFSQLCETTAAPPVQTCSGFLFFPIFNHLDPYPVIRELNPRFIVRDKCLGGHLSHTAEKKAMPFISGFISHSYIHSCLTTIHISIHSCLTTIHISSKFSSNFAQINVS